MSLIAKSNAYQLSSTYPGTWDVSYVPYYARRYVRRLDAEELHDAIAKATGIPGNYTLQGSALPPVQWAMQFPDTRAAIERRVERSSTHSDAEIATRCLRRSDGSILQSLDMMNSPFVDQHVFTRTTRARVWQTLLSQTADAQTILRDLFLNTLSRPPTDQEIALFTPMFQQ